MEVVKELAEKILPLVQDGDRQKAAEILGAFIERVGLLIERTEDAQMKLLSQLEQAQARAEKHEQCSHCELVEELERLLDKYRR